MHQRRHITITALAGTMGLLAIGAGTPVNQVTSPAAGLTDDVLDTVASAAGVCSDLDPADCLLPFPNDEFTTADPTTPTGLRVDISPLATPRNVAGKPVDPTELNRNDGWSPGSMLLAHVPGLDLQQTWGIDGDLIEQPSLSLAKGAPIVLVDADTGARHPFIAELDTHPETGDDERLLIIRPLVNFLEGHRYVIGLGDLRDGDDKVIPAREPFASHRDEWLAAHPPKGKPNDKGKGPGDKGPKDKGPTPPADPILDPLAKAGVDVAELYLAWDFTIASGQNLAGRALAIRDQAFAALGDTDLGDGVVEGDPPAFTIDQVTEIGGTDPTVRRIEGTLTVPNFLTLPQGDPTTNVPDDLTAAFPLPSELSIVTSQQVPGSRFVYGSPLPGPMDTPVQNPVVPTAQVPFSCALPRTATAVQPALPTLYGHGLLGGRGEAMGGSTSQMRRRNHLICAVDWWGMSTPDLANVVTILADASNFPSLADRSQQGFLNFMLLGRALAHPGGLAADAAFQDEAGQPLFDPAQLVYDGNSQGGIMGGALTALAPDLTRSVLGVPAINYSTLLHRSVDWEGTLDENVPIGYSTAFYTSYPDKQDQLIAMALIQMLWDRAEGNGYAQHMSDQPLPNTPAHQVLLHLALGDYQVANLAAEVQARTIGARFLQTALAPGRHWADGAGDRLFAHQPFDLDGDGAVLPHQGSAIVYWDSGNPLPPNGNVPPEELHQDPHGDPRNDPFASDQKAFFYRNGTVIDVHGGAPYWTFRCPRHPDQNPGC